MSDKKLKGGNGAIEIIKNVLLVIIVFCEEEAKSKGDANT
jgi:hypothetical protein